MTPAQFDHLVDAAVLRARLGRVRRLAPEVRALVAALIDRGGED